MTAAATSLKEPMATHHFVLMSEGVDRLEWETLDAVYRGGCGDATVGHHTHEFDRTAPTRDEALCSALRDAESASGVRVLASSSTLRAQTNRSCQRPPSFA